MKSRIAPSLASPEADAAAALLERCVHCGFCTATCPTYQLLGDERDGPRGRLYLVRQLLETGEATARTREHLDRCLACRACETACPSGVEYARVLDAGRQLVARAAPRPLPRRLARHALAALLTGPLFAPLLAVGRALRPVLPRALAARVPVRAAPGSWPSARHERRVLLLAGCVQPAIAPRIDAALARVLDQLGVSLVPVAGAGCCGAIHQHLEDDPRARAAARRNVDAWWPLVEQGAEAIVASASGCAGMLREYGWLLRDEPAYAARAARLAALVRDPAELLLPHAARLRARLSPGVAAVALHAPCSQQHPLRLHRQVEQLLRELGAPLQVLPEPQACCGSAGTYSLLQPRLSQALRGQRLAALQAGAPEGIVSANIGCIVHLAAGTPLPVLHWLEWLDARLAQDTG